MTYTVLIQLKKKVLNSIESNNYFTLHIPDSFKTPLHMIWKLLVCEMVDSYSVVFSRKYDVMYTKD